MNIFLRERSKKKNIEGAVRAVQGGIRTIFLNEKEKRAGCVCQWATLHLFISQKFWKWKNGDGGRATKGWDFSGLAVFKDIFLALYAFKHNKTSKFKRWIASFWGCFIYFDTPLHRYIFKLRQREREGKRNEKIEDEYFP